MNHSQASIPEFFGVALRGQTYLNMVYLFLAFPLGLFYFLLIVLGFSMGIGLLVLWIGGFILAGTVFMLWACAGLERQMAIWLLHEELSPTRLSAPTGMKTWDQIKSHLSNPVTWKSLAYLVAKFPLGILSFTALVSLISLTLSFLAAPVLYRFFPDELPHFGILFLIIDNLWQAIGCFFVGVVLFFASLHILNWLARLSKSFASVMLF